MSDKGNLREVMRKLLLMSRGGYKLWAVKKKKMNLRSALAVTKAMQYSVIPYDEIYHSHCIETIFSLVFAKRP